MEQVVNQEDNFALLISAYSLQGSSKPGTKYGNLFFACCSQFRNKTRCIVKGDRFRIDFKQVVKQEENVALLFSAYCSQFRNKTRCILKCCRCSQFSYPKMGNFFEIVQIWWNRAKIIFERKISNL